MFMKNYQRFLYHTGHVSSHLEDDTHKIKLLN